MLKVIGFNGSPRKGYNTDQMVRILYNGRQLEGEKTLSDYGVVPFGQIFWLVRLRG